MKPSIKIFLPIIILLVISGYVIWQKYAQDKYNEVTDIEYFSKEVIVNDASEADLIFIQEVRDTAEELYRDEKNLNTALDLSGFPRTIVGLIDFWNHQAPPYSFFDHDKNKKETIIASFRSLLAERGNWLVGKNILFRSMGPNSAGVVVFLETPKGITSLTYRKKLSIKSEVQ